MEGGPPSFQRDFPSPAVLRYPDHRRSPDFAYGTLTLFRGPFQAASAIRASSGGTMPHLGPTTPDPLRTRFGLLPVRSPLLRASRLISLPPGTEMFQFPGFASPQRVMTGFTARRVSPFGHLGITACVPLPRAYRSLPRPSSPPCAQASPTCLQSLDYVTP